MGADASGFDLSSVVAAVIRDFLQATQTQLTVSGLFALNDSLHERDLVAVRPLYLSFVRSLSRLPASGLTFDGPHRLQLFRNSHLSVLYKRPADPSDPNGPLLYSLVTDESLLREPEVRAASS